MIPFGNIVLIVPSGIETAIKQLESGTLNVLIVPSGIETDNGRYDGDGMNGINCT